MSATLPDAALVAGRRNCWTCKHNREPEQGSQGKFWCDSAVNVNERAAWVVAQTMSSLAMPPKTADGCPGYEAQS